MYHLKPNHRSQMRDWEPPDPEPMHPNITTQPDNTGSRSSNTQPTVVDEHYDLFTRTPSSSNPEHQNVLIECNVLVEEYPKGETPKSTVYVEIQSKLAKALGDDRAKSDAAFGSSSLQSRVMIPSSCRPLEEEQRLILEDTPPALLSRNLLCKNSTIQKLSWQLIAILISFV